jgi:hypothetical protein
MPLHPFLEVVRPTRESHDIYRVTAEACGLVDVHHLLLREPRVLIFLTEELKARVDVVLKDLTSHASQRWQLHVGPLVWLVHVDSLNQVATTLVLKVMDATSDVLILPPLDILRDEHLWLVDRLERRDPSLVIGEPGLIVPDLEPNNIDIDLPSVLVPDLPQNQVFHQILVF